MSLKEKALIVDITISTWSGRKFDRKVTQEVNDNHNTVKTGNFNKLLVDTADGLDKITSQAGKIRQFHIDNTLPWANNGDRLLPTTNYTKYVNGLTKLIDEYKLLVKQFIEDYSKMKVDSKYRLKDLYNEKDYPTTSQLEGKFNIRVAFQPMPDELKDFRLSLSDVEVERLKEQINVEIKDRHAQASADLFERAKDAIQHIIEALSREGKKTRFHSSTINKISELVEIFPALNYSGDTRLTELTKQMKSLIIEPDNLRKDAKAKAAYLSRAKELDKLFF